MSSSSVAPSHTAWPTPRRVAIFRALQLGDMLCSVPALRALRTAWPHAEITLIGLTWAKAFAERYRCYLDAFSEFPGYPGLPETSPRIADFPKFIEAMQAERFQLALQMHGSGVITNPLVMLFGARINAGCYSKSGWCPDATWFTPYPEGIHEIRRQLHLLEFLGIPTTGDHMEFPIFDEDQQRLRALQDGLDWPPALDYVCVHPGARAVDRRWSLQQFAAVGDALADMGFRVVLTGSREEADVTCALAQLMVAPAIDLGGRTDLGTLGALLRGARLLVSNNTGVYHLACAIGTPSVTLFHHQSEICRWGPLDQSSHRPVVGYTNTTFDRVRAEINDLLNNYRSPALPAVAASTKETLHPCNAYAS